MRKFARTFAVGTLIVATLIVVGAPQGLAKPKPARPALALARASLVHADGTPAGMATLTKRNQQLVLSLKLTGLPVGEHGLHLHTTGKCDAPDFKTAGGHLNPGGHQHGLHNPLGSHMGDVPNITANTRGDSAVDIPLAGTPDAVITALFDADGSAIVVHASPDDYRTDPSGNSGARIACGVFTAP